MRILSVGNMYPPFHLGGYELVWRSAVHHLRARGHVVRVLASDYRIDGKATIEDAEGHAGGDAENDVHRELRWYWRDHQFPRLPPSARFAIERHNARTFARHTREVRPDLVLWWAMGGMSLSLIGRARHSGLPAAAAVCDDWIVYGPRVDAWTRIFAARPRLGRWTERLTGIPTSFTPNDIGPCLFPSETTRDRALEAGRLAETSVCHQGVDLELFQPSPARDWSWRLLCAGRIDPRKGIDTAILALSMLPERSTLTIAGAGDERHLAELRELVDSRSLSDRVSFERASRERVAELYAKADALLFPVRWEEPWGLVPLEAMACGTPVIATGRGGGAEYLRDGENCLIFSPEADPSALAERVRALAEDEELRLSLREGGLATATRFSEREWNEAVERLCRRAVAGSGA